MTVDELAHQAAAGNPVAFAQLAHDLRRLIHHETRRVFWPGGDRDDVAQEGLLALWVACRDWQPERGPFAPFVAHVIRRRLDAAVRMALREKHVALNTAAGGDALLVVDVHPVTRSTPEQFEQREQLRTLTEAARTLTPIERHALGGSLDGDGIYRGAKTAEMKRLDNALQRARRKLREAIAA